MPIDFADALRKIHLLAPAQLDELTRDLRGRFPEDRALAAELIRRDWLTPYQVNQLLQGRGGDLLLGSYVLLERIGEGGMGAVFKARNWKLGNVVALKLVRPEKLDNADAVRRFHHEIRAAAQLDHPNIVRAIDADEVNGVHLLVMEYVPGVDLAKLMKKSGPLPIDKVCDYTRQAALGLQHAHERGMVHRDVKPAILLLTPAGVVKILDMGLARLRHSGDESEASATMTQEGAIMGTLDYIAPEQAMNSHTVDIRADLYSLGCTLYFLLSGKAPFPGGSAMEKLIKHQSQEPAPVEQVRSGVPAAVGAVVRKLMAKRPEDRYQTPAEAATALAATGIRRVVPAAMDNTVDYRPAYGPIISLPPTPRRERRGVWLGVVGGTGVILAAIIVLMIWKGRPAPLSRAAERAEVKVEWKPGPAQGMLPGLIARPARLPGIRRWQVETQLPRSEVTGVSWSPDGKLIAYGDKGGRIRLIDAETRRLVQLLPGHEGGVWAVAWSPDGAWLATAGADKTVRLWRPDGTRGPVLTGHTGDWVCCVAWSKDGKRLASGGDWVDHTVRIWSVDGTPGPVLPHDSPVNCVAWSPDGPTLASTDTDKRLIRLWNTADGTPLTTLGPLPGELQALAWSPDGKYLASGGGDVAKEHVAGWIWDVAEKKRVVSLEGSANWLHWLGWNAQGGLASVAHDGYVVLFDPRNGEIAARTAANICERLSASWAPDGRRIADSTGRICTVSKGGREITPTGFQRLRVWVWSVAWNPDGKRLASSGNGGAVRLWDADGTPGPLLQPNVPWIPTVAWSPDGTRLAAGTGINVQLWNADGTAGLELRGHENYVGAVTWSPDGKHLASAAMDRTVRLWDADGTPGPVLRDKRMGTAAVAWSSDGKRLAAAGDGGTIHLWDADGTPGPVLDGHANWVPPLPGTRAANAWPQRAATRRCVCGTRTDRRGRCLRGTRRRCVRWPGVRTANGWPRETGRALCDYGTPMAHRGRCCGVMRA